MKMKRIIAPALAMVIVAGGLVIGLPILGDEDAHESVTLENMATQILGNNLDVIRANEEVMIAKYKHDLAVSEKDEAGSTVLDTRLREKYNWKYEEMNYDYALWSQGQTKLTALLDGEVELYNYGLLLTQIQLEQDKLIRLESDLDTVNLKLSLGRATTSDVSSAQLAIEQQTYAINQLINDKDAMFLDLNKLLGYDLTTVLVPEETKAPYEIFYTDGLAEDVERTLTTNGDLEKLEDQLALARIKLDVYDDLNFSDQYDDTIIDIKEEISDTNLDIKDKKLSLEYDVRSAYNNLTNAKETVFTKELELENLEMTLDTLQKRFDVGLEIKSTVDVAAENVAFARLAVEQAKLTYYEAAENYKILVGLR